MGKVRIRIATTLLCILANGCSSEYASNNCTPASGFGPHLEATSLCNHDQLELLDCHKLEVSFFWAPWLPTSEEYLPHLDELAKQHRNVLRIRKISIDDNADWAGKWNIISVPTILFIKNGQLIGRCSQFDDPSDLRELIESTINTI